LTDHLTAVGAEYELPSKFAAGHASSDELQNRSLPFGKRQVPLLYLASLGKSNLRLIADNSLHL